MSAPEPVILICGAHAIPICGVADDLNERICIAPPGHRNPSHTWWTRADLLEGEA